MKLSDMKISMKVMTVIAVMGAVSAGIAGGAIIALGAVNTATTKVDAAADRAVNAAKLRANFININRDEFRLAANPTTKNVETVAASLEDQMRQIDNRLTVAKETINDDLAPLLAPIEEKYASYKGEMQATIDAAKDAAASEDPAAAQAGVVLVAEASMELVDGLLEDANELVEGAIAESGETAESANGIYSLAAILLVAGGAIGLALGLGIGLVVSRNSIVQPIQQIVKTLQQLAGGNLSINVQGAERKDEIGEIAKATLVFKDNLVQAERMRGEQEASRERREKRQTVINDAIGKFQTAAEEVVATVSSAASELQASANTLSATAAQSAEQANSVAVAAEQTSANVQSVAAATEELAASVADIGTRAHDSNKITRAAVTEVDQTNAMVRELETASQRIGAVVGLIGDIAAQTNLLALNATIEAARAGDSGRGFAVVAGEVKSLAEQAAKAAEEITREIAAIQSVTTKSVTVMEAVSTRIKEISTISANIASAVQEQSAATREISRNVQEASSGTTEVTQNIGSVSTSANETGQAATQVQSAASELAMQSNMLRREFDSFIAVVRAA